jgi:hypothetical protein
MGSVRYFIAQGQARPPIEVEIVGVPPCLFCGEPVTSPSMDGPLVCGPCDCGCNRDGSKWTHAQAEERHAHQRSRVTAYRAQMIDHRVREMKDLLAKMTSGHVEGGSSDDAAFIVLARKLLPDLIERDELRGAAVTRGVAKGEPDSVIAIGNTPSKALHAMMQLRASLRTATEKLRPEMIRELRTLIDDPQRPRSGEAYGPNQADYERKALPVLLVATLMLLNMHEEVAKLAKEEPFVKYELAKGGQWP